MADAQSILAPLQIPDSVKADAWDAYQQASSVDDLTARLKKLPLTDSVRGDLWDAKNAAGSPPGALSRFGSGLYASTVEPLLQTIKHPIDTAVGMAKTVIGTKDLGDIADAVKQGRYGEAAAGLVKTATEGPGGRMAHGIVDPAAADARAGNYAGAAGRVLGTAATLAAPEVAGEAAAALKSRALTSPRPLSAGALQLADKLGVPLTRGMQGGNRLLQGTEKMLGTSVARDLYEPVLDAGQRGMNAGAEAISGNFTTDRFSAGASTAKAMLDQAQDFHGQAQDEYGNLARLEADPANVRSVQTGTKPGTTSTSAMVDASGRPTTVTTPDTPIREDIGLPADMRPVKRAIEPEIDEVTRRMTPAQRRADPGLTALQNILARPDVLPASVAEADLGYLKSIGRSDATPQAKRLAGIAADALQPQVDAAVSQAGPDAVASLQKARSSWAQHADILDLVKDLSGDQSGATGQVRLANKLLQPSDAAVPALRKVLDVAPEAAAPLGNAYLTDRVFKGVADGADFADPKQARNLWNQIGPRTKAMLYPAQQIADIDHFFELSTRLGESAVAPGNWLSILMKAGVMAAAPLKTIAGFALGRNIAKVLYAPDGAAALSAAIERNGTTAGGQALQRVETLARGENTNAPTTAPNASAPGGAVDPGATQPRPALPQSVPAGPAGQGARTSVDVPGEARSYAGRYEVRELGDVQPSHSGITFQPNPRYQLLNDRNYDNPANQRKVIDWSAQGPTGFKPSNLINTVPDSSGGPPVIDSAGNVYGGNGRTMIMQRVARSNSPGMQAYRQLLDQQAGQFGIDPASYAHMKQPILVRVLDDAEFAKPGARQAAVTDFNKTGTAALTPNERSIADSRRVSTGTLDDISKRLDDLGPDATLAQALEGRAGSEVLGNLISDGVISPQERAALDTREGLTKAGRDRISSLMLGRFFSDPAQMDKLAPALRNKMERIAAPLARTEGAGGFDLSGHTRGALDLIEDAATHGASSLDEHLTQDGLFGAQKYSPEAVSLAKQLVKSKPTDLTAAVRSYAEHAKYARDYQGPGMFNEFPDPKTPRGAFNAAFGTALPEAGAAGPTR